MEPDERTLLCKAIFNPFWRPFSPSFFESFVSHLSSHPHPFRFGFTASSLSNSLYSLCLFLSWQSPLIQSRLNYAGFSSGDCTRKGGGKKQNQNRGSVFRTRWHRALKKKHVGEFLSAISEDFWCRRCCEFNGVFLPAIFNSGNASPYFSFFFLFSNRFSPSKFFL